MSVSTTNVYNLYNGSGSTDTFPVTFQFIATTHLRITKISASGVETVLALGVHYTVTGGAVGSTIPALGSVVVVPGSIPAVGEKIRIERVTPTTQGTVHSNNDAFPAKTVEGSYDYRALVEQEAAFAAQRAPKQSIADFLTNGEIALPSPDPEKVIGWNEDGSGLENYINPGAAAGAAAASATSAASSASAAAASAALSTGYATKALAAAATIASTVTSVSIAGYAAAGDGGAALYKKVVSQPTHVGKFQSADGAWWEIAERELDTRMFGAKVDNSTDDTTAVQSALDVGKALNLRVLLPYGTSIVGQITIYAKTRILGKGAVHSTLKAKSGLSTDLITPGANTTDDIEFRDFSIDGNYPTVTTGNTLTINGVRPRLVNLTIINSAGTSIVSTYTLSDRLYSILGHFEHITIDKCKTTGWNFAGPNDSYFSHIEIVDASLGTDVSGYGFICTGAGTLRAFNMHIWNRSPTGNKPIAGIQVSNNGNIFHGCHFESGQRSMILTGSFNQFTGCSWYAPDGLVALLVGGSYNVIEGMVGGGADAFFSDFLGCVLGLDGSNKSGNNIITLLDAGCNYGAVDFTNSSGKNIVKVRGDKPSGKTVYVGTPTADDDVDIIMTGVGGLTFVKPASVAWTAFTPTVSASTGAITTASASCRYRQLGSICEFEMSITITTNGTGAGRLQATLPIAPASASVMIGMDGSGLTPITGYTGIAGNLLSMILAAGTYPGANGKTFYIQGTYEIA